jgi:glycosyltransferase involved in cell wall biosynthesis
MAAPPQYTCGLSAVQVPAISTDASAPSPTERSVSVTALVCTRERPASLVRAVRSLLAGNAAEDIEVIVIDQDDTLETERALAALAPDSRLRHVRSASRGVGSALCEGLALARGEFLVCTDDDCEAPPHWIEDMARTLAGQPTAAVVFCGVKAAPHDVNAGYIPAYERRRSRLVRSIAATCAGHGLSAGMAVRRDVIRSLGGFDVNLGPGARFPAADDWDLAFRALLRGWHVYETADLAVIHHGFRTFAEGREHARRDWLGIGAVCAKLLRARDVGATIVPVWEFSAHAIWPIAADLLSFRRPRGLTRIMAFSEGLAQGLRTPLDPKTLLFKPEDSTG